MPTWKDAVAIAKTLPGVEVATWYGTVGLKVAGKGFARLRTEAEGGLVLMCSLDEKQRLLESGEPAYYTTPHYDGYGSIIVNLGEGRSRCASRADGAVLAHEGAAATPRDAAARGLAASTRSTTPSGAQVPAVRVESDVRPSRWHDSAIVTEP